MLINKDIVIIGGGIAGLWLLDRLRQEGFHAVLLEHKALGQGQSIASQGMIHGGMKYALDGKLGGAADAIADMPAHWKRCLQGRGDVDLRGTRVLSDAYYMWPGNSLRSRLNAFFGSKLVRGRIDKLDPNEFPAFFRNHIEGPLYRLQDIVLDVPSLLQTLAARNKQWLYRAPCDTDSIDTDGKGNISAIHLPNGNTLCPRQVIFTSGEAGERFIRHLGTDSVKMQRRPLHMVIVRHGLEQPLYVHCVSDQLRATPELTITTHQCSNGETAWYLGGELAEAGVDRDEATQQQTARDRLDALFPWAGLATASYSSFRIDRAEARQPDGKRPDHASVHCSGNAVFCWPTKLTLAPALANRVCEELQSRGLRPAGGDNIPLQGLQIPAVAIPPWEQC